MMNHKEALTTVSKSLDGYVGEITIEIALCAYLDARGMVMVPKEPTEDMRYAMDTEFPFTLYEAMLAAAPDPFKDGE